MRIGFLDIETSGLYPEKNGITEVAIVDRDDPTNRFHQYCRIDDTDEVDNYALQLSGMTEEQVRNATRSTQKEMLSALGLWTVENSIHILCSQNPSFDKSWLDYKGRQNNEKLGVQYRAVDSHTMAQVVYHFIHGEYLSKDGKSMMDLSHVMELAGLRDNRMKMEKGKIIREGTAHTALEDALILVEIEGRLMQGIGILEEYKGFSIPQNLVEFHALIEQRDT